MSEQQLSYITSAVSFAPMSASIHAVQWNVDELRKIIREEVRRALHPEIGTYDTLHFLTVEAKDEQGKRWRGVLYAIEEEQ